MIKLFMTFTFLLVLWLSLSGIYDNLLIIGFGIFSSALCAWIVHHLKLLETQSQQSSLRIISLTKYLFWLVVEIGKADWAVTKVIIAKDMPLKQRFLKVPSPQRSDFSKMLFANSITITPGTITVETESDHFIVHALTDDAADMNALNEMSSKVSNTEMEAV